MSSSHFRIADVPGWRESVQRCPVQVTGGGETMTLVNAVIDEQAAREIASRLEADHPLWMVVYGVYTQQFICFPKFNAPYGAVLVATYPEALHDRMKTVEETIGTARPGKLSSARPREVMS